MGERIIVLGTFVAFMSSNALSCNPGPCPDGFLRDNRGNCVEAPEGSDDDDFGSPDDDASDDDQQSDFWNQMIYASADTYIENENPEAVYGTTSDYLYLGARCDVGVNPGCSEVPEAYRDYESHVLVAFDVADLAGPVSSFDSAQFGMLLYDGTLDEVDAEVYSIDESWSENDTSWEHAPSYGGHLVATADSDELSASVAGTGGAWQLSSALDVSSFVQTRLEQGADRISLAIVPLPHETDWAKEYFCSREYDFWVEEGLDSSGPMLQLWFRE